jgi:hypothetical protein
VQRQRQAQRLGGGLAGVVVGRGADAAEAEHDVAAGEALAERLHQARALVAHVAHRGQPQAAGLEESSTLPRCLSSRRPDSSSSPMMIAPKDGAGFALIQFTSMMFSVRRASRSADSR